MPLRELPLYRATFQRIAAEGDVPTILGSRSKCGGEPWWSQEDETPKCRKCRKACTFVMQIDSFQHDPRNELHGDRDYLFADVGMIYVFYCFNCNQPESVFQC
jgi:hypothetical protein